MNPLNPWVILFVIFGVVVPILFGIEMIYPVIWFFRQSRDRKRKSETVKGEGNKY